jgi:hypothetical protein
MSIPFIATGTIRVDRPILNLTRPCFKGSKLDHSNAAFVPKTVAERFDRSEHTSGLFLGLVLACMARRRPVQSVACVGYTPLITYDLLLHSQVTCWHSLSS